MKVQKSFLLSLSIIRERIISRIIEARGAKNIADRSEGAIQYAGSF